MGNVNMNDSVYSNAHVNNDIGNDTEHYKICWNDIINGYKRNLFINQWN